MGRPGRRAGIRPGLHILAVLTPLPAGAEIDWQVRPLQAPGVEGVTIAGDEMVDTVIFKRYGGPYTVGDVSSDADKIVIREEQGQVRSLSIVQGTTLHYKGQVLVAETRPVSRAMDL